MKHKVLSFFTIILTSLTTVSCDNDSNINLSGNLNINNDTLFIRSTNIDKNNVTTDTVVLNNGNFQISMPDSVPLIISIKQNTYNEIEKKISYTTKILMLPGDRITINGDLKNPQIRSILYDELNKTEFYKVYNENEALRRKIAKVFKTLTKETIDDLDSLLDASQEMDRRLNETGMNLVKEQPDNIASAFATLKMFDKESIEATKMLSEKIKSGSMKKVIENNIVKRQNALNKQEIWNGIKIGLQAPDFKLCDMYGTEKTLASFKNKYLVLEFWGTWCPWCIKGLPMMRNYYEKYKSKVEFIGINCRDTDEAWRKCIDKYELTWTQLYNGTDKEILKAYGILGFPSKIIIDKDGKIAGKYLDEENTFYEKLDELFGE